jgi:hypothetical protein
MNASMSSDTYRRLILVPGLLETGFGFIPLKRSLQKHDVHVEQWRDRIVFRSLESSVDRLAEAISGDASSDGAIGIVTHSFGDWVARAAIAKCKRHRVRALVSLAPVMRAGFLPSVLYLLTGNLIPEIKVIMDKGTASANLDCDHQMRRLVIWSRFDESLRRVPLDDLPNVEVQQIYGTHLSMVWQPNVIYRVNEFLFRNVSTSSQIEKPECR